MNISTNFLTIGISGLALLGGISSANAQTYTIRFNPHPGLTRYAMDMKTSSAGGQMGSGGQTTQIPAMKMVMSIMFSMKAKTLPHGQHKIEVTYNKVHMVMNGKSMDEQIGQTLKGSAMTMVMDSNGKVLKTSGTGAMAGMGSMMGGFSNLGFFGKPITVGKTFSATTGAMGTNAKMNFKLLSVQKVGGRRLATLSIQGMSGAGAMMKMVGTPTTVIDVDTGMLVSMSMSMVTTVGGGSAKTQVSMHEVR